MKLKNVFCVSIMLLFSFGAVGQADFRPGYYLTHEKDTIHGLINYRGDLKNTKACIFKENEDAERLKLKPDEIYGYRFAENGRFFVSRTIKPEEEKEKRIFIEYLVNGIADLYYYRDKAGDHYLIEKDDGKLHELTNKKEVVHHEKRGPLLKTSNKHIGILKATFSDCIQMFPEINKAELTHESLMEITKSYHNYVCEGEKCIVYKKEIPPVAIDFAPTIGMGLPSLSLGNNPDYSSAEFTSNLVPSFGFLVKATLPRWNERLSFQFEGAISKSGFEGFNRLNNDLYFENFHYNIEGTLLQTSLALKYTFPEKGKFTPTLAGGLAFNPFINLSTQTFKENEGSYLINTTKLEDEFPLAQYTFGPFVQLGIDYQLTDKYTMFTNLKYSYTFNWHNKERESNNEMFNTKLNTLNLVLGVYLF